MAAVLYNVANRFTSGLTSTKLWKEKVRSHSRLQLLTELILSVILQTHIESDKYV